MSYDVEQRLRDRLEKLLGGNGEIRHRFFDGIADDMRADIGTSGDPARDDLHSRQRAPDSGRRMSDSAARAPKSTTEQAKLSTQVEYVVVGGKQVMKKLKTPISRTAFLNRARNAETQPQPRWPSDIDQVYPAPRFPYYNSPEPEPFHQRADQAYMDKLRVRLIRATGPAVYERRIAPAAQFYPSRVQECDYSSNMHTADADAVQRNGGETDGGGADASGRDDSLHFDSRFESGNLQSAIKAGDTEYLLHLSTDLYTTRHTQWFFFRVSNTKAGTTYTFNIMNLLKSDSLYNHGMQPVVYSEHLHRTRGIGWHRAGDNVCYFKNHLTVGESERHFYTLSWTYKMPASNDTVYFAHCYPYTYTDLQHHITELTSGERTKDICRHRVLCRTLAGNMCDLLTVTNFGVSQPEMQTRKGVIVTARVHPGETNASWMMKGFLDFITGTSPDAELLRDNFVFKIVPMLNPDGVIVGNYRCSLAGVDLNRTYKHTIRELYPTIYSVKLMMQRLARDRPVVMYCDLHGHSRKHNVFVYGCHNRTNPDRLLMERIFPLIMHLNGPSHFSYKASKFSVKKCKESTGRIVTWRELNIVNAFTMEATFCGSTMGAMKKKQFRCCDFEALGGIFFDSLLDYCDPDQAKTNLLWSRLRSEAMHKGARVQADASGLDALLAEAGEGDEDEDDSPGSDSSPSEGETEKAEIRFRFGADALQNAEKKKRASLQLRLLRRADSEPAMVGRGRLGKKDATRAKLRKKKKKRKPKNDKRKGSAGGAPPDQEPEPEFPDDADSEDNVGDDDDDDEDEDVRDCDDAGNQNDADDYGGDGKSNNDDDSDASGRAASSSTRARRRSSMSSRLRRKYKNLSNRGIPTFANDRVTARAARKSAHAVMQHDAVIYDTNDNSDCSSRGPAVTDLSPLVLDLQSSGDEGRCARSASMSAASAWSHSPRRPSQGMVSSGRHPRSGLSSAARAESLSPKLLARMRSAAARDSEEQTLVENDREEGAAPSGAGGKGDGVHPAEATRSNSGGSGGSADTGRHGTVDCGEHRREGTSVAKGGRGSGHGRARNHAGSRRQKKGPPRVNASKLHRSISLAANVTSTPRRSRGSGESVNADADSAPVSRHLSTQFLQLDADYGEQRHSVRPQQSQEMLIHQHLLQQHQETQLHQFQRQQHEQQQQTMLARDPGVSSMMQLQPHGVSHHLVSTSHLEDARLVAASSSSSPLVHRRISRSTTSVYGGTTSTPRSHHQHQQQQQQRQQQQQQQQQSSPQQQQLLQLQLQQQLQRHTVTRWQLGDSRAVTPESRRRSRRQVQDGDPTSPNPRRKHSMTPRSSVSSSAGGRVEQRQGRGRRGDSENSSSRRRSRSLERPPGDSAAAMQDAGSTSPYPAGTMTQLYDSKFGHVHPAEDVRESTARRVHTDMLQRQMEVARAEVRRGSRGGARR